MSGRSAIVKALAEKFKGINGQAPYTVNLYENVLPRLKFWDEINDFPFLCVQAGHESREYLPSAFKWGFLNISIKLYVQCDDPVESLEQLITDVEQVIDSNQRLMYAPGKFTEEMSITSIDTDEGVLAPMGVGDVTVQVRYPVM